MASATRTHLRPVSFLETAHAVVTKDILARAANTATAVVNTVTVVRRQPIVALAAMRSLVFAPVYNHLLEPCRHLGPLLAPILLPARARAVHLPRLLLRRQRYPLTIAVGMETASLRNTGDRPARRANAALSMDGVGGRTVTAK